MTDRARERAGFARPAAGCRRALAAGLLLAAAGAAYAGSEPAVAATNGASTHRAVTNVLALWLDVSTNAARDCAALSPPVTNWPGAGLVRTGAVWQMSALLDTSFFCERRTDVSIGRRITWEGCYQSLEVGWEKHLGDGIVVGVGVGAGAAGAFIRSPP